MGAPRASSITRLEQPRVAIALVSAVFVLQALVRTAKPVTDQDSFWIAAAGREMLATGRAPRVNAFSFTDPAHPWVFHELGFGVIYAKGLAWAGAAFVDLFGVFAGSVTVAIAAAHIARTTRHRVTLALCLLPVLVEVPIFHPLPMFASLGLVAALTSLAFAPDFRPRHAALAVVVQWLWTLFHGSFPLGVVILLVAAVRGGPSPSENRPRSLLVFTAGAALAVTFLNPYGPRLHGLVKRYLVGDDDIVTVIHQRIIEFRPIWRAPFAFGLFDAPALALVTGVALACLYRRREVVCALFVLLLCGFAASEVRNVHFALLLGAMLLAPEVDRWVPLPDYAPPRGKPAGVLFAVLPGLVAATLLWAYLYETRPAKAWLGPNIGGPELFSVLSRIPDDARVYAPFGVSSPVVWYGGPRGLRVFYDSRNDCYSPSVAMTALTLGYSEPAKANASATLQSFGTDCAITLKDDGVTDALSRSDAWQRIDEEGRLNLFIRRR